MLRSFLLLAVVIIGNSCVTPRETPMAWHYSMYLRFRTGGLFPGIEVHEEFKLEFIHQYMVDTDSDYPIIYQYVIRKASEPAVIYEYIITKEHDRSRWCLVRAWKTNEMNGTGESLLPPFFHFEFYGSYLEAIDSETPYYSTEGMKAKELFGEVHRGH
jgi:hypothetical protein